MYVKEVPTCKGLHNSGPLPPNCANFQQYQLYEGQVFLTCTEGNNCCEIDGNPVLVQNIPVSPYDGVVYLVYKCKDIDSFYNNPLDSTILGIIIVSGLEDELCVSPISEVNRKMVFLRRKGKFVAIPQLHKK